MRIKILSLLLATVSLLLPTSAFAASPADVTNDRVTFDFPISATFSATITANAEIRSIVLEYGNEQQTCGDVVAKAFPQFTPTYPKEAAHLQMDFKLSNGASSPINCARKIPGPCIFFIFYYLLFATKTQRH